MRPLLETILFPADSPSINYFVYTNSHFKTYWHHHPEIEISLMLKGKGLRYAGDGIQSFEEGELLLLGENLPHDSTSEINATGEEIAVCVLQFSRKTIEAIPECKQLYQLFEDAKYGLSFSQPSTALIEKIKTFGSLSPLQKLIELLQILNLMNQDKARTKISSVSFAQNPSHDKLQNKASVVTQYILNHLDQPLSLDQVASFSGMTPNSFCRWFKKSVRRSFISYLNTARIERACKYLVETDWKVSQIAYKTGFENISHFNRVFKKLRQQSPSHYRKSFGY